jgi:Lipopolysaccharide-assembly
MRTYSPLIIILLSVILASCGVYSFTGASIEGKSIYIHVLENKSRNIVPSLSANLSEKIKNRILSQTGLAPINNDAADYDLSVSVSGLQNNQTASLNRLTISVEIIFKNKKNEKANFTQSFNRFADFSATQTLQSVEQKLIEDIGNQLADDIFNKAFVNW